MPAASISPELAAKFQALADSKQPLSEDQLRAALHANPTAEPRDYLAWLGQYLGTKARGRLSAAPMSRAAFAQLLRDTRFDDPKSLAELVATLSAPSGVERMPLGKHTPTGGKSFLYFLEPYMGNLPDDFERLVTRGPPYVTQARCTPAAPDLPGFFRQIGQLLVASAEAEEPTPIPFVVVVDTSRQVYAFFNPYGIDPVDTEADPDAPAPNRTAYGMLPSLPTATVAVKLGMAIDALLSQNSPSVALDMHPIGLPTNGKIEFGGPDTAGWRALAAKSTAFASVPTYSAQAGQAQA